MQRPRWAVGLAMEKLIRLLDVVTLDVCTCLDLHNERHDNEIPQTDFTKDPVILGTQ